MKSQPRTSTFRSPRTKVRFLAKLVQSGVKTDSPEFLSAQKQTARKGKHAGRQPGAFGKNARKRHRDLYGAFSCGEFQPQAQT